MRGWFTIPCSTSRSHTSPAGHRVAEVAQRALLGSGDAGLRLAVLYASASTEAAIG
jgi:hypothetical protein